VEILRQEAPEALQIPAPLDFTHALSRVFDRCTPRLLVFNELEIWPNWWGEAARRRIPLAVINGRMSPQAAQRYRLFNPLLRNTWNRADLIALQDPTYLPLFEGLGLEPSRLTVTGNAKADHALPPPRPLPPPLSGALTRPLLLGASTHPEDHLFLLQALPKEWSLWLAPRHPAQSSGLLRRIRSQHPGRSCSVLSALNPSQPLPEILIIDRMGILCDLYPRARAIWMGGTLDPRLGGHNLFEAAANPVPIVGGAHTTSFPGIARDLAEAGAYHVLTRPEELTRCLLAWHHTPPAPTRGPEILRRYTGALERTIEALQPLLPR